MLKLLDSEHELLALMGHEISYIDKGAIIESLKEEFGGDHLADILLGNEVPKLKSMANWLPQISYSEQNVIAADTFAVALACPFRYNAFGMESFLNRLKDKPDDVVVDWLEIRKAEFSKRIEHIVQKRKRVWRE